VQRLVFAGLAGTVASLITNGIMATVVIGPFFEERYRDVVANSIDIPLLIAGYLIIGVALAALYPRIQFAGAWYVRSLFVGGVLGAAVFLGSHAIIAAYTTIDAMAFVASGLFDSFGPVIGAIAVGIVYRRAEVRGPDLTNAPDAARRG
jgi:uncharacterized membrane protein YraQ (UPF0718 family)